MKPGSEDVINATTEQMPTGYTGRLLNATNVDLILRLRDQISDLMNNVPLEEVFVVAAHLLKDVKSMNRCQDEEFLIRAFYTPLLEILTADDVTGRASVSSAYLLVRKLESYLSSFYHEELILVDFRPPATPTEGRLPVHE